MPHGVGHLALHQGGRTEESKGSGDLHRAGNQPGCQCRALIDPKTLLDTLSAHELAWCRVIVELPCHNGGLGITHLPASGMGAFYCATARMVSWLSSLPYASEWVACQNLADPNTWNSSALQPLKQLHDKLLTHYNCTEWAPPLVDTAPAPDAPAQGRDDDSARPLPFLRLTFTLFCVFGRMWTMAKLLLVRRYLHNVKSQSTSC